MESKKYVIQYDWSPNRNGHYSFHEYFETNFFLIMLIKFILLMLRHNVIDIEYRHFND